MARTQTMVQLNDELVAILDHEAGRRGLSRSALIREVLEENLGDAREASIAERIVAGYERFPSTTPDEWGDLSEQTDRARMDLLHRLDSDERASGHEPW